jgi:hypothetical protein
MLLLPGFLLLLLLLAAVLEVGVMGASGGISALAGFARKHPH